jgi:hypothetical protein
VPLALRLLDAGLLNDSGSKPVELWYGLARSDTTNGETRRRNAPQSSCRSRAGSVGRLGIHTSAVEQPHHTRGDLRAPSKGLENCTVRYGRDRSFRRAAHEGRRRSRLRRSHLGTSARSRISPVSGQAPPVDLTAGIRSRCVACHSTSSTAAAKSACTSCTASARSRRSSSRLREVASPER